MENTYTTHLSQSEAAGIIRRFNETRQLNDSGGTPCLAIVTAFPTNIGLNSNLLMGVWSKKETIGDVTLTEIAEQTEKQNAWITISLDEAITLVSGKGRNFMSLTAPNSQDTRITYDAIRVNNAGKLEAHIV